MSEKNNLSKVIVVSSVVVIGLIAVGAYLVSMNNGKDDNKSMMKNDSMSADSNETVMVGGQKMFKNKDIVDNVVNAPNLTTLVKAVQTADLVAALKGPGPLTVFGPDNDAFAALPSGAVDKLLKPESKDDLQNILKYHVVSGKYLAADLKDGQVLTTLNSQKLTVVKKDGKTTIKDSQGNMANIKTADVLQSNGVAHVVDKVLLSDSKVSKQVGGMAMLASRNIVANVSEAQNLTTLVAAVKQAGLVETLSGPGPFTVFGPNNDAFAKLPAGTLDTLLKPENKATLTSILTYHAVSGNLKVVDLTDGKVLTTVNGQKLTVINQNGKIQLKDAKGGISTIVTSDVPQSNGTAHVIDSVLMPNS